MEFKDKISPRVLIITGIALILIIGFYLLRTPYIVSRVGSIEITKDDIDNKKKILLVYRDDKSDKPTDAEALRLLIISTKEEEVYKNLEGSIPREDLEEASKSIDENTLNEGRIKNLQIVLGYDDYLKSFIKPKYINNLLMKRLVKDVKENRPNIKEQSEDYLKRALVGENLLDINLNTYGEFEIDKNYLNKTNDLLKQADDINKSYEILISDLQKTASLQEIFIENRKLLTEKEEKVSDIMSQVYQIKKGIFNEEKTKALLKELEGENKGYTIRKAYKIGDTYIILRLKDIKDDIYTISYLTSERQANINELYSDLINKIEVEIFSIRLKKAI